MVQKFDHAPGDVITSLTLLDPAFVRSQQKYSKLLLTVKYIETS